MATDYNKWTFDQLFRRAIDAAIDPELVRILAVKRASELAVRGRGSEADLKLRALLSNFEDRTLRNDKELDNRTLALARIYHGLGILKWYSIRYRDAAELFASAQKSFDEKTLGRRSRLGRRVVIANRGIALKVLGASDSQEDLKAATNLTDWPPPSLKPWDPQHPQDPEKRADALLDLLAIGLAQYALGKRSEAKDTWIQVKNSSQTNSGEQRRENPLEALIKLITRNPEPDTPQVDPNEPAALKEHRLRALINLITIETQDDELDRAQKYMDEADPLASDLFNSVDMTPLHRDYLLTKADLELARKKTKESRGTLEELNTSIPLDAEGIYRMASLELADNHREKAQELLAKVRSLAPYHPGISEQPAVSTPKPWAFRWYPKWFWAIAMPIVIAVLLIPASGAVLWPMLHGSDKTTTDLRIECAGKVIDLTTTTPCPDNATPVSVKVTRTEPSGDAPHDVPASNLGIAGALAGVALLLFLFPNLSSFKLGQLEVKLEGAETTSPATLAATTP